MRELLGETKVGTLLQLPTMRLRASELTGLEPGMIFRLPLARRSLSELRVGGLIFGRAHPVQMGEHRGAQLEGGDEKDYADRAEGSDRVSETLSVN
jgi:flagellar motor switch protein FliM